MKSSNDLHLLVRSLTKSEKRYFKLFAGNNDAIYLRLFDLLDKQTKYNEEAILKKLNAGAEVKHFSYKKNYLYHLLLKLLTDFHGSNSNNHQTKTNIFQVQLLIDRGLTKQAYKLLLQTKKSAQKTEEFLSLIELLEMEQKLVIQRQVKIKGSIDRLLDELDMERTVIMQRLSNLQKFRSNQLKLSRFWVQKGGMRNTEDDDFLTEVLQEMEAMPLEGLSFREKEFVYDICKVGYMMNHIPEKATHYSQLHVDLYEANKPMVEERLTIYVKCLGSLIQSQLRNEQWQNAQTNIDKLDALYHQSGKSRSVYEKALIMERLYNYELQININQNQLQTCPAIIDRLEPERQALKEHFNSIFNLVIDNKIMLCYFYLGQLKLALQFLNRILNHEDIELREDIHCDMRIFSLLLHYDLGNAGLMEYQFRSTHRFLYKKKRVYRYEDIILKYMRKFVNTADERKHRQLFKALLEEVTPLQSDPYEQKAFEGYNIIAWLQSKIERKPILEFISNKPES
jgi:hypothetical protein